MGIFRTDQNSNSYILVVRERAEEQFSIGYSQASLCLYFTEILAHSDKMLGGTDHTEKQVVNDLSIDIFNKYPNV